MVLTYSMVLNRLDQLNERERQVRDFYKPLPGLPREKPWPRRHRFADKLEVEDVVKTMGKGDENWDAELLGVDNVDEVGVGEAEGEHLGSHISSTSRPATVGPHSSVDRRGSEEGDRYTSSTSAIPSFGNSWQIRPSTAAALGPSRESRKMVNYAVKKEKQLRKAVDEELNERREKMRERLQMEVGLYGENEQPADIQGNVEPLFRPPGRVAQVTRKPTVHKTGTAPSKELAVYETAGMHWTGGPTFHTAGEDLVREQVANEYGDEIKEVEEYMEREEERKAQAALLNANPRRTQHDDDDMSDDEDDEDGGGLDGDYSTWRYRKTLAGDHEDPEQRDFYFAQVNVAAGAVEGGEGGAEGGGAANRRFIVKVIDETLRSRPEFTFPSALACDHAGFLLFPRKDPFQGLTWATHALTWATLVQAHAIKTTVMSPADDLPWVSDPRQLLGHMLRVQVFARTPQLTRGPLVSERMLHFRPPADAYHPPASAPVNYLNTSGSSTLFPPPPRPAARPDTAPAQTASPGVPQRSGLRERSGAASPGGKGGRKEAVEKWNNWVAEGGAAGGGAAEAGKEEEEGGGAEAAAVAEENSAEGLSPLSRKKRELAKMRQQMRASLQQTQNKMMAGTPASTDARASSVQAGGAPGGVAPMVVSRAGLASAGPLRRQPSGSGRSPGRPASQQASREG